ncbi:MAG TPA: hypothetical protein DCY13_12210 [Verrucomicrobiales bacterium]|nr:hypothetical protein [Verrucomicrobiales bacterium]
MVSAVCDLEAWELRPEVEAACARGAVDETIVSLSFVAEAQEGRCGSLWATFCDRHQPLNNVADATGYLDKLPEIATSSDPEERDGPALNQPGLPYHAPPKVGRNDPCPCGSGRKFKKCCGKQ